MVCCLDDYVQHNTDITQKLTEARASIRLSLHEAPAVFPHLTKNLFADCKRQIKRSCDVIFRQPRHALVKQRVHCFDVTEITRTEKNVAKDTVRRSKNIQHKAKPRTTNSRSKLKK